MPMQSVYITLDEESLVSYNYVTSQCYRNLLSQIPESIVLSQNKHVDRSDTLGGTLKVAIHNSTGPGDNSVRMGLSRLPPTADVG